MDNICHTLVGVAAARAGLNQTTRFAGATLAIAANLPDIDVAAFATGIPAVALRRGLTHGVVAQALLPVALAGAMYWIAQRRGRPPATDRPAPEPRFAWLLALSYIGVLSHVFLDYVNTYGVRLLMPFRDTWFYGDSVFIVDLWLWLLLGLGAIAARGSRTWPARAGLALSAIYIAGMMMSAGAARAIVEDRWVEATGAPPMGLMVGPVPVDPLRKTIIVDAGDRYVIGRFRWYPRGIAFDQANIPKGNDEVWTRLAAAQDPDFNALLVWARFPFWTVEEDAKGAWVTLRDVRFREGRPGFAVTTYVRRSER